MAKSLFKMLEEHGDVRKEGERRAKGVAGVPEFRGTPEYNVAQDLAERTPGTAAYRAEQAGMTIPAAPNAPGRLLGTAEIAGNELQVDIARRNGQTVTRGRSYDQALDTTGQFGGIPGAAPPSELAQFQAAAANSTRTPQGGLTLPAPAAPIKPRTAPVAQAPLVQGADMPTGSPLDPNAPTSKVGLAADQAAEALGPAPMIDQGLADRQMGNFNEALGMSREVIDRLLNGPSTAERVGSQTLRNQLALARSAAGGPGAVQEAMRQAQFAAPELQAQATQSALQEQQQRDVAAGNVASNFAQAALGARGQDVGIAAANQQAASNLISEINKLSGVQLEMDQRNQELLGQMARDAAAMEFNWSSLSAAQQQQEFDRWVQVYGIDKGASAQLAAIAASQKKSPWDIIIPMVGAAATIGGAVLAGPAGAAGGAAAGQALSAAAQ